MASRKNRPHGSVLRRACWCKCCKRTCPVHVLGAFFSRQKPGSRPFKDLKPGAVLKALKERLLTLKVPQASSYRAHDFRRGHARDLQADGAQLFEILAAGEWRSPAFLKYMDVHQLEHDVVVEAHVDESSDDEFDATVQ